MSIIKRMRKGRAAWWQKNGIDKYGRFTFNLPVEIKCRWVSINEQFLDSMGKTEMSNALVYVDRIMEIGDVLKEGEIDSTTPDSPVGLALAFEIRKFDRLPNLRYKENLLTAFV